jgi:voltage-gated potassium channel Kch
MRKREKTLKWLTRLLETNPDLRIGQLISNALHATQTTLYYISDDDLYEVLKKNQNFKT